MTCSGGSARRGRSLAVAIFVLLSAAVAAKRPSTAWAATMATARCWSCTTPPAHAFTDGSAAPQGEALHCVLCHLTRTVRPAVELAHHAPAHGDPTLPVRRPGLVVPAVFPAAEPPLRSPPVSL